MSPRLQPCVRGFTLIELMISMLISLLILGAMVGIFVNTSASQREMEKLNGLIENGRIAGNFAQLDGLLCGDA